MVQLALIVGNLIFITMGIILTPNDMVNTLVPIFVFIMLGINHTGIILAVYIEKQREELEKKKKQ